MAGHVQSSPPTPEEYLRAERQAPFKSEFLDGTILAMSGASLAHNVLVANLIMELGPRLRRKGCQIYPSDLKVRQGSRFFYPDVSAICGEPEFHDDEKDVVLNPSLLIEVLSPSTEKYDKGIKFLTYQQIPSLQEYLLVHQDLAQVEVYRRHLAGSWLYSRIEGLDGLLEILGIELSLEALYSGIRLVD
jgi:Uma2 family endonuclease